MRFVVLAASSLRNRYADRHGPAGTRVLGQTTTMFGRDDVDDAGQAAGLVDPVPCIAADRTVLRVSWASGIGSRYPVLSSAQASRAFTWRRGTTVCGAATVGRPAGTRRLSRYQATMRIRTLRAR